MPSGPTSSPDKTNVLVSELTKALRETQAELKELREMKSSPPKNENRWLQILGVILTVTATAVFGAHAFIWSLNARVVKLEEGQFTAIMAAGMEARLINQINGLPTRAQFQDHEERLRELERVHRIPIGGGSTDD